MTHGLPVRLASHDEGDGCGHFVNSVRESRNIGRIIRAARASSKTWQGVTNGLSCLGESRQAFISKPAQGRPGKGNDEENQGTRLEGPKTPQKRGGGAKSRAAPQGRAHLPAGYPFGGPAIDDSPVDGRIGQGRGAYRATAGLRRYRLPARYSEPAWLRTG